VPEPLRRAFHRDLDFIDGQVARLFALVTDGLAAATDTLLAGDRESARAVLDREALIDSLYADIEVLVQRQLMLQAPVAGELRYLLSVVRIVPELERSGDLVEHIATRGARGIGAQLSPQIRGLIDHLGQILVEMWRKASDAYAERDGGASERLNRLDDQVDDLHTQLIAEVISSAPPTAIAIEMALIGRFYERLGDHALHITERFRYLAEGS
jgi:phosphate transport system protein